MTKIFEMNHVSKQFGKFKAVSDMTFNLEKGHIYGLIGPNGAGKSTTMSLMMGLIFPTQGSGKVKDYSLGSKEAKLMMGYSPEFPSFYTDMSCLEYLLYMGELSGLSKQEAYQKTMYWCERFNLLDHLNDLVHKFSTGMKKKVGFIQAIMHEPELVLLDEPTANLDPISRNELIEVVRELTLENKCTFVISSHVLAELQMIVDHVLMINQGRLVFDGTIEDIQSKFNQAYLELKTSNNALLADLLVKKNVNVQIENNQLIVLSQEDEIKLLIIELAYKYQIIIHEMKAQMMTLDHLYAKVVGGENDEDYLS